jgi:hypothetical protein
MGGAETATGPTCEAEETEVLGGRFGSHKGSHEEALGGLPQSPRIGGVSPTPEGSRRSDALDPVMTLATTRIVKAAALSFCLVLVVLANASLLAGAAAKVTCADCPVLSVNPRASRPLGRAADRGPCRIQTRNGLPLPDPKCTLGAINPTVTLAVLREQVLPHRLRPKLLDDPEGSVGYLPPVRNRASQGQFGAKPDLRAGPSGSA